MSRPTRSLAMRTFLDFVHTNFGGPLNWLAEHGWNDVDSDALRTRLLA